MEGEPRAWGPFHPGEFVQVHLPGTESTMVYIFSFRDRVLDVKGEGSRHMHTLDHTQAAYVKPG
jgi:hypothetical protein